MPEHPPAAPLLAGGLFREHPLSSSFARPVWSVVLDSVRRKFSRLLVVSEFWDQSPSARSYVAHLFQCVNFVRLALRIYSLQAAPVRNHHHEIHPTHHGASVGASRVSHRGGRHPSCMHPLRLRRSRPLDLCTRIIHAVCVLERSLVETRCGCCLRAISTFKTTDQRLLATAPVIVKLQLHPIPQIRHPLTQLGWDR